MRGDVARETEGEGPDETASQRNILGLAPALKRPIGFAMSTYGAHAKSSVQQLSCRRFSEKYERKV